MSILRLILREMLHRKLNFLLGLTSMAAAIALFVGSQTLVATMGRETVRLMRDMGFNILVLPDGTSMADFWSAGYAEQDMPQDYVKRLADSGAMTVRHLVARLQRKVRWRGRSVLLTGVLPEVPMAHRGHKLPMGLAIPRGEVHVGYELARDLGIETGDTVTLSAAEERSFVVSKVFGEPAGSADDIRIYGHLTDVQEVLGAQDRINEIQALSCMCVGEDEIARLGRIREELQRILPGTQVSEFKSIAVARAETRAMMDRYAAVIVPCVLAVCGVWVGLLALANVRERRVEIGVLRATGLGGGRIAALFLGKAVVMGLLGALVGFALGTGLALHFGPRLFPLTASRIAPMYDLLLWVVVGAPLLCAAATYIPAMLAVVQDPAVVLREE